MPELLNNQALGKLNSAIPIAYIQYSPPPTNILSSPFPPPRILLSTVTHTSVVGPVKDLRPPESSVVLNILAVQYYSGLGLQY